MAAEEGTGMATDYFSAAKTAVFLSSATLPEGPDCRYVSVKLQYVTHCLYEQGYVTFLCDLTPGFDMLAALTILKLKKEYPRIKLVLLCPQIRRPEDFKKEDQKTVVKIMTQASHIVPCETFPNARNGETVRNEIALRYSTVFVTLHNGVSHVFNDLIEQARSFQRVIVNLYPGNEFTFNAPAYFAERIDCSASIVGRWDMYAIYSIYAGGGEWIEETMNNDQLEKLFTPDGRLIYYCYDFEDNVTKYNFEPESGRLTIGNDVVYVIRLTHNEMICIDWNDKENAIAKTVYHRIA